MGRRKNLKVLASIPRKEFAQDYLEARMSHRALAHKYNCSKAYIPLVLEKLGISPRPRWILREMLSKEKLENMYVTKEMSEDDIADNSDISKSSVSNLLREHGIPRRTLSDARSVALKKGKISTMQTDKHGKQRKIQHHFRTVNHKFFKKWSPQMAWVLGVIATDGSLESKRQVAICQKEPELLWKLRSLLGSDAPLIHLPKRGRAGAIYRFAIGSRDIVEDLNRLGVPFNKSLKLRFPKVPQKYMRHFLRGCWDGDGSVYWGKVGITQAASSICGGSRPFIAGIRATLVKLGLPPRPVEILRKGNSKNQYYNVRWHARDSAKLYHVFYHRVSEDMYLSRKYKKFKAIAEHFGSS